MGNNKWAIGYRPFFRDCKPSHFLGSAKRREDHLMQLRFQLPQLLTCQFIKFERQLGSQHGSKWIHVWIHLWIHLQGRFGMMTSLSQRLKKIAWSQGTIWKSCGKGGRVFIVWLHDSYTASAKSILLPNPFWLSFQILILME